MRRAGAHRDADGGGLRAGTTPITATLAASPPSAVFFSDAACATAVPGAEVRAGANSAEVYFRATQWARSHLRRGEGPVRRQPEARRGGWRRGARLHHAPQMVASDACSRAVTVQSRDAFDNPAKVSAATSIQLLAPPARSVTFYAKPDCKGAAMTATSIPADGDSATFYFKGRLARTVAITAALGAASVSQDEIITPAPGQKGR